MAGFRRGARVLDMGGGLGCPVLIEGLGFKELAWLDGSARSLKWFQERLACDGVQRPPPLGVHLLRGAETGAMIKSVARNLAEDRIRIVMAWERT